MKVNFVYFSMQQPCKYSYETDGLTIRIVDTRKNLKDSIKICQQFGEELASINNQKRLNDTLHQMKGCYEVDINGVTANIIQRRISYRVKSVGNISSEFYRRNDDRSFFLKIPDTSHYKEFHPNSGFLCSKSNLQSSNKAQVNKPINSNKIIGLTCGGVLLIFVIIFFVYIYLKKKKSQ